MPADYYEILQVHPKADQEAIEAAYRRLRELYDPARLEGAADELVQLARQKREAIDRAYATLGDRQRRANYDAEVSDKRPTDDGRRTTDDGRVRGPERELEDDPVGRWSVVADHAEEDELDYRPLPPAGGAERPRGFREQPVAAPRPARRTSGRNAGRAPAPAWMWPAIVGAVLLAAIVGISFGITGGGGPPPAQPTATPSAIDQYEPFLPQLKQAAEQSPRNAQLWIDYGNALYDSVQSARELEGEGVIYQQRLPRWLEATRAYSRALELEPNNWLVRADLGASACFYGVGTGDQSLVQQGTSEARRAFQQSPDDPRVLLSLGHCLVNGQPPQTNEALELWRKVVAVAPDSPLATQARTLIAAYSPQQ